MASGIRDSVSAWASHMVSLVGNLEQLARHDAAGNGTCNSHQICQVPAVADAVRADESPDAGSSSDC